MENDLIYPIYLDVPMMTSFLASIDNCIIESTEVETKNLDAEKNTKKGKLQAGISGVLGIFKVGIEGLLNKNIELTLPLTKEICFIGSWQGNVVGYVNFPHRGFIW